MSDPIVTYGWDFVYAARLSGINKTLEDDWNRGALPHDMACSGGSVIHLALAARCGAWELLTEGGADLVSVRLPLTGGQLALTAGKETRTIDVTGTAVVFQLGLRFIKGQGGQNFSLVFNLDKGALSYLRFENLEAALAASCPDVAASDVKGLLWGLINDWIAANANRVTTVLASLHPALPDIGIGSLSFQWVNVPRGTPENSLLGVLMTAGDASRLPRELSAEAVPPGCPSAVVIARPLFLTHFVGPSVRGVFSPDANAVRLTYDGTQRALTGGGFYGYSRQVGLVTYTPRFDSVAVGINAGGVTIAARGTIDMGLNITSSFNVRSQNPAAVSADGTTLVVTPDPSPQVDHSIDIPWYDYLLGLPLGLVGGVIGAVVTQVVTDKVADSLASQTGSFSGSLSVAVRLVRWGGGTPSIAAADLRDDVCLGLRD